MSGSKGWEVMDQQRVGGWVRRAMLLGGLVGGDGELTEGREKGWKVDGEWGR